MKDYKAVFFGPAVLVTAAMIGPGTVFTASQAGAKFGFSLLWAVAFATATGIILQEMAGRLGIATSHGLPQAIRRTIKSTLLQRSILGLMIVGIFLGNSAYQTGNLLGASGGVEVVQEHFNPLNPTSSIAPSSSTSFGLSSAPSANAQPNSNALTDSTWSSRIPLMVLGALVWSLILIGRLEWIQRILTGLVILFGLAFLFAAIIASPSLNQIMKGLVPSIPAGSGWLILGLIGTTVFPYNLFLHASAAAHRWPAATVTKVSDRTKAVQESAKNTRFAVGMGGLITAAILITAALTFNTATHSGTTLFVASGIGNTCQMAVPLEPAWGAWAKIMFGIGLFAAGLTSAIAAPVAAAYAIAGSFGWPSQLSDWRLKLVASVVLLTGFQFALVFGNHPQDAILMAQVANGFLLPLLAILLLVMVNRVDLVTRFHNRPLQNFLSITVIAIIVLIAARQLMMVYAE